MSEDNLQKKTGLDLLRAPFLPNQISKLPKPTKKQTDDVKADFSKGRRCKECGGWHHPDVVHLDYVGHAALTDRLLDADPLWNWEPIGIEDGLPKLDKSGGLWIKLTVCGHTRLGYGHADGKTGGDSIKETIGDALRNAAMRFGAALDLWHKGDLHLDENENSKLKDKPIVKSKPAAAPNNIDKKKIDPDQAAMDSMEGPPPEGDSILDDLPPKANGSLALKQMEATKFIIPSGSFKDKKLGEISKDEALELMDKLTKHYGSKKFPKDVAALVSNIQTLYVQF